MNRNLKQAFVQQKKSQQPLELLGTLGIAINGQRTVEVDGRNGFVYVQLRNNQNELIQAMNDKVSPVYGLPVIVVRQGNRYVIKGRDTERYTDWQSYSSFLPRHGDQHSFNEHGGGGDIVDVYGKQFIPMLVMPSGSLGGPNLVVAEYIIKDTRGNWRYSGNTGTPDILGYKPQGTTAVVGLVAINRTTGNPRVIINSGTFMPGNLTGTADIVRYLPQLNDADLLPAMAFRIASGTSSLGWGNLYDIRQYYNEPFQGSSANIYFLTSGSSGVGGFDLMTVGRPTGSYFSFASTISTTGTMLADFITEPNVPNAAFISDGIYHLHIHATRTGGTKDARLRYLFGKISSGGVQTLLHTSELSNLVGNSEQEFDIESLEPEHDLSTDDRLWVNIFAVPEGGGSTPTISIKINGDTLSRFEIPALSSTSSGGLSSIPVQDEGVPQGNATTFNFVGAGVTAGVAGGLATITIPSGGGTSGGNDTQVQYNVSGTFAGNSNFVWNYDNGYLRIGPAHPYNFNNFQFQLVGTSPNTTPTMSMLAYGTGTSTAGSPHPTLIGYRQRGTVLNSPEGLLNDDGLLLLVGAGYDGANFINSARLRLSAQGTWITGTYTGSKLEVQITPSGTNTRATRFEVVGNGANIPDGTYMVGGIPHTHQSGWELIQEIKLTNTGTFSFQNIPQTYRHLKILLTARSNRAAAQGDGLIIRLNNDSSNSYLFLVQWGAGQTEQATATSYAQVTFISAAGSPAGYFSNDELTFFNYTLTGTFQTWQARGMDIGTNSAGNLFIYDGMGSYLKNVAISRIDMSVLLGTAIAASSCASLYGIY